MAWSSTTRSSPHDQSRGHGILRDARTRCLRRFLGARTAEPGGARRTPRALARGPACGARTASWPNCNWAMGSAPARARTVRGFSVTNSPYNRPSTLGIIPFGGPLGPGWTVEAYRGGRLVGFDSVNALGQLLLRRAGAVWRKPGRLRCLRSVRRDPRIQPDLPRAHRWHRPGPPRVRPVRWCLPHPTRCSANGNIDLRYGLSDAGPCGPAWTSSGATVWAICRIPMSGIVGAVGNAVTVEGEAVGRSAAGGGAVRAIGQPAIPARSQSASPVVSATRS